MIKTRDLVPNVYYDQSRDFQFFGRVYEIVYNYIKTNIDLMQNLPLSKNSDLSMIGLVLSTLGFSRRHEYNSEDLKRICTVFIELIRLKGTRKAVELAIATLMSAQNINTSFDVMQHYDEYVDEETQEVVKVKTNSFDIYIPIELKDIELLEDIFDYILPSGYEYRIFYSSYSPMSMLKVGVASDKISGYAYDNIDLTKVAKPCERDERPTLEDKPEELSLTYTGIVYKPQETSQEESQEEEESNNEQEGE